MVAGHGEVVRKNGVRPSFAGMDPSATADLVDTTPQDTDDEIVLILAGSLTGFTAGAMR
jgi:hypothetical protein